MVIDQQHETGSVFHLFAARSRRRSRPSLVQQLVACAVIGASIAVVAPVWWPVSAMLGAAAGYAGWGLVDRLPRSLGTRIALRWVAIVTTALVILAITGVGLAAFTGDGRSPYGMCYDQSGRAFACDARGVRRP